MDDKLPKYQALLDLACVITMATAKNDCNR